MINIFPEYKVKKFTIDTGQVPEEGEYLVTIKKGRKPGKVYQVCSVRKVNSKVYLFRYQLEVIERPKLIPEVKISFRFNVVIGEGTIKAHAVFLYNKKHKPKKFI